MAGISTDSGKGGRRKLDAEINMIPMIDLLMVTVSFLLITAVWTHSSRLEGNAQVPGPTSAPCEGAECKEEARLHVQTSDPSKFVLVWKQGGAVVRTTDVPRDTTKIGKSLTFPALASKVNEEWNASGVHKSNDDKKFDHAVVHTSNEMPYGEIIAVMDAVSRPTRPVLVSGKNARAQAFDITFATD